jgi:phage shock protein C
MTESQGLFRSRKHKVVAGVAAGMAERFRMPIWLVRLIWFLLFLPGGLPGVIPYLVLWIVVPLEPANDSSSH